MLVGVEFIPGVISEHFVSLDLNHASRIGGVQILGVLLHSYVGDHDAVVIVKFDFVGVPSHQEGTRRYDSPCLWIDARINGRRRRRRLLIT